MILVDMNQVMIATLMASLRGVNAVEENLIRHMVLNTLRTNRRRFQQEYGELVLACDGKNYWRKQIFPYYKASRKKLREKSTLDWNAVFDILNKVRDEIRDNFPYPVVRVETAEADDVIATLCQKYGRELGGDPILILSGDKDFIQLQKYSNVKQFDPVRKRWIQHNDPVQYLSEHVLRGDTGDGIPNFLSPDDVFVSGGRQKQLRQAKIEEIRRAGSVDHWSGVSDELLRNYHRNLSLIDLTRIPEEVSENILSVYEEQQGKGRAKLFNYFVKNKLKNLMTDINEF